MHTNTKVRFFFQNSSIRFSERTRLKSFIEGIFKKERKKLENLNYIFCTDDYLLKINRKYLKHDFYTDIISFDLSETPNTISGDIYISTDRVKENAKSLNINIKQDLMRVIFHGALHLCGYKDKNRNEIAIMREKENDLLKVYFKKNTSRRST